MKKNGQQVNFCGEVKHETDRAYLVYDGYNEVWLPKSQIHSLRRITGGKDDFEIIIPEWLAIQKGII